MPGSMIHLSVAKKISPNASLDFYIGNLAPDAVLDREKKEISHLRNAPDRETALREFALKVDNQNEYLKGIILHLFVDWKWDSLVISDFAEKHGDGWFPKYRDELGIAVAYAFHNTDWSYTLWEQLDLCEQFNFAETEFITREDIKTLISRQRKWQMDHKIGPSSIFSPKMIDKFVTNAANDFIVWYSIL